MSIRKGSKIIAGSGGSGDGDSIKNQNLVSPITKVYDWIGTLEEYEEQQVATSHPDWVCFILDDTKQYNHQLTNRNVGDIFYTLRKDEELNGAVECNGNTYDFTDFTGKESISNLLKADKLPYISLSEYTTQLEATNGTVGVFGWDGGETTTFRVPKLEDILVESGNINNVGEFMPAGLPNITGSFDAGTFAGTTNGAGAFTGATAPYNWALRGTYTGGYGAHYPFDASNSNAIYGNSTTVQPKAIRYRPMIQLFTGFADEAVETCQSVKADVENLKETKANIVDVPDLVTPNYANPTRPENNTVYLADKTYLVTLSCGAGDSNEVLISQNADMSDSKSVAGIYITSTGNIFFTVSGIIPKGWYYKVIRPGGTAIIYPIGQ